MFTAPIKTKSVILAQNWLKLTHTMPILHCRCGVFNSVGLHGADVRGCSGEAPGVIRGSLRHGWLQTGVAVSGDALWCTVVRSRVGNNFISLIHEGWLTRARGCSGNIRLIWRDGDWTYTVTPVDVARRERPRRQRATLPGASDLAFGNIGPSIWMWRRHCVRELFRSDSTNKLLDTWVVPEVCALRKKTTSLGKYFYFSM